MIDPVRRHTLVGTQLYLNSLKGLTIVSCNVRSLNREKLLDVKLSLDCDFLCINESWVDPNCDGALIHWPGKTVYRNDRDYTTGGGLLTYVTDELSPYCVVNPDLELMHPCIEVQAIEFNKPTYKAMLILNVYRPPKADVDVFFEKLEELLKKIDREKFELWLCGDLNINTRERNSHGSKGLFDICRVHSVKRLIDEITRPNENDNGGTCLDQFITNCDIVSHSGVLNCMIADHYATFACRKKPRELKTTLSFTGRSYRNYDRDDMCEYLLDLDWNTFHQSNNPDTQWCFIYSALVEYLDIVCPIKTFTIKKESDPWVTTETIELINERQELIREMRHSNDVEILRRVRRMRNRTQRQLVNSQSQYVLFLLEQARGDPQRFWREVNKLVNPVTKNLTVQLENELTGEVIPVDQTASYINNYFSNIGQELFSKLPPVGILTPDVEIDDDENLIGLDELICKDDVEKLVKKINVDKSSGLEGVNSRVLKDALLLLVEELTTIFRNSLREGIFPDSWSCGLLVPIPKKGNLKSIKNWRPITLLPLPGKLLEKIVHKYLSAHLERESVLCATQFGFRPGRGTSDAVFNVVKDLYEYRDEGYVTAACFIDFCKAFDCVHHPSLISKIAKLKINGRLKKWLTEYLSHRSHQTMANGIRSTKSEVNFGVPQGSILGPLLFVLFINDLPGNVKHSKYTMYADDVVLYVADKDAGVAVAKLQADLDQVNNWCNSNFMTVNSSKSMVMYFGSGSKIDGLAGPELFLGGQALPICTTYPYLGVTLDSKLSILPHITKVKKSFGNRLYKLCKLRKCMSKKVSLDIYKVMIVPVVEYCSFYTGSGNVTELAKLQRMQNQALRVCCRVQIRGTNIAVLHDECGVELLERRRKKQLLNIMWKKSRGGEALEQAHVRTRGDLKVKFAKRRAKTSFYQKCPYYRGVTAWDKLTEEVQKLPTKRRFKHAIHGLDLS